MWNHHPPQRQRPFSITHRDIQQIERVIDHRPIPQGANLAASVPMNAFEDLPGSWLERIKRNQFLALHQALESLHSRLDLNSLGKRFLRRFRQGHAPAISAPDHQQHQVFQVRFMKTRHQAFQARSKLISYFSQIHLSSPCHLYSTTSGDYCCICFWLSKNAPQSSPFAKQTSARVKEEWRLREQLLRSRFAELIALASH